MPSFFVWLLNWYCSYAGGKGSWPPAPSPEQIHLGDKHWEQKGVSLVVLPQKLWRWISVFSLLLLKLISVSQWSMEYLITKCHHRHVLQPLLCHSYTVLWSEVLWRPLGSMNVKRNHWRIMKTSVIIQGWILIWNNLYPQIKSVIWVIASIKCLLVFIYFFNRSKNSLELLLAVYHIW